MSGLKPMTASWLCLCYSAICESLGSLKGQKVLYNFPESIIVLRLGLYVKSRLLVLVLLECVLQLLEQLLGGWSFGSSSSCHPAGPSNQGCGYIWIRLFILRDSDPKKNKQQTYLHYIVLKISSTFFYTAVWSTKLSFLKKLFILFIICNLKTMLDPHWIRIHDFLNFGSGKIWPNSDPQPD